jgi:hypothetical protein
MPRSLADVLAKMARISFGRDGYDLRVQKQSLSSRNPRGIAQLGEPLVFNYPTGRVFVDDRD